MTKLPYTVARNAFRVYNKLVVRTDEDGKMYRPMVWTHCAVRLEIAAKQVGAGLAVDLRTMAVDARKRANLARVIGWLD